MTPAQKRFLVFVDEATTADGFAPTIREVMAEFGHSSTNSVADMARRLEGLGWLRPRGHQKSRGFVLTDAGLGAIGREKRKVWVVDDEASRGLWFRSNRDAISHSRKLTAIRVSHRMYRAVSE